MKKIFVRISLLCLFHLQMVAQSCTTPTDLRVVQNLGNSVSLRWDNADSLSLTLTEVRQLNSTVWRTLRNTSPMTGYVDSLQSCTYYVARVRKYCQNGGNSLSDTIRFKTEGCTSPCNYPQSFSVRATWSNNTHFFAASWLSANTTDSMELAYRSDTAAAWTSVLHTNNGMPITTHNFLYNVPNCTNYWFKIRKKCGTGAASTWSPEIGASSFCPTTTCAAPAYVRAALQSNGDVYVSFGRGGGFSNPYVHTIRISSLDSSGYNRTDTIVNDTAYTFRGTLPCGNYLIQVARICNGVVLNAPPITVNNCLNVCGGSLGISSSGNTDSSISIAWSGAFTGSTDRYRFLARHLGLGTIQELNISSANSNGIITLNNLAVCTDYAIWAERICSNGTVTSNQLTISTNCPGTCPIRSIRDATFFMQNQNPIRFRMSVYAPNSIGSQVELRNFDSTATGRLDTMVNDTSFFIQNGSAFQNPCANYMARARAICSGNLYSSWSNWYPVEWINILGYGGVTVLSDTSVRLDWLVRSNLRNFNVNISGGGQVRNINVQDTSLVVRGLQRCTNYSYIVSLRCPQTGRDVASYYGNFATAACTPATCTPPSRFNLTIGFAGDTILGDTLLRWQSADTSVRSTILQNWTNGVLQGTASYGFLTGSTTAVMHMRYLNLTNCQRNYVTVQNYCSNGGISAIVNIPFTYRPQNIVCLRGGGGTGATGRNAVLSTVQLDVSPNPSDGNAVIRYEIQDVEAEIRSVSLHFFNLQGQEMIKIVNTEGISGAQQINIEQAKELPTGTYLIQLRGDGKILKTTKWVKL